MATQIAEIKQQALVKKQKAKTIPELIKLSLNELGKALPAHLNAERLGRIALTTMRLNFFRCIIPISTIRFRAECRRASIFNSLYQFQKSR